MSRGSKQELRRETASEVKFFAYSGPSMNPTFFQEDLLEVEKGKMVSPGDVVFFRSGDKFVVHRAIALTPQGIVTRGDNNPVNDNEPVLPENVVGIVVAAWRGNSRRLIQGGRKGVIITRWLHYRRMIREKAAVLLRKPYRNLVRNGLLRFLAAPLCPRVIRCGESMHLLLTGRVVGSIKPGGRWWIKHPWKLFVDEGQLPRIAKPGDGTTNEKS